MQEASELLVSYYRIMRSMNLIQRKKHEPKENSISVNVDLNIYLTMQRLGDK